MKEKARLIVMSHLSDIQEQLSGKDNYLNMDEKEFARNKLDFCKFVILKTAGDLSQEIDADELYNEYLKFKS